MLRQILWISAAVLGLFYRFHVCNSFQFHDFGLKRVLNSRASPIKPFKRSGAAYLLNSPSASAPPTVNKQLSDDYVTKKAPLKTMVFMDGTWAYYAIYLRNRDRDEITKQYGNFWPANYFINWKKLPEIIASCLTADLKAQNPDNPVAEVVKVHAFTSMKNETWQEGHRFKMMNDLANADVEMHKYVTEGPHEKGVDISLAVDLIYLGTQNAYDIAVILTGDKDFLPALTKVKEQLGKRVALCTLRNNCANTLLTRLSDHRGQTPSTAGQPGGHNVIYLNDHFDTLIQPIPEEEKAAYRVSSPFAPASTSSLKTSSPADSAVDRKALAELEAKKLSLVNKTVPQLKNECKLLGVKCSGIKSELKARIEEALDKSFAAAAANSATATASALEEDGVDDDVAMAEFRSRNHRKNSDDYFFHHVLPSSMPPELRINSTLDENQNQHLQERPLQVLASANSAKDDDAWVASTIIAFVDSFPQKWTHIRSIGRYLNRIAMLKNTEYSVSRYIKEKYGFLSSYLRRVDELTLITRDGKNPQGKADLVVYLRKRPTTKPRAVAKL